MKYKKSYEHGDHLNYFNGGCRCEQCSEAARNYSREKRKQRLANPEPRRAPQHGDYSRYTNYGCRCEPCKQSRNEYEKKYTAKKKEASQ